MYIIANPENVIQYAGPFNWNSSIETHSIIQGGPKKRSRHIMVCIFLLAISLHENVQEWLQAI